MKELMAELLECCCLQQGREALAEQIIAKHMDAAVKLAIEPALGAPLDPQLPAVADPDAGNSVSA